MEISYFIADLIASRSSRRLSLYVSSRRIKKKYSKLDEESEIFFVILCVFSEDLILSNGIDYG